MDVTRVVDWSREALRVALVLGGPPLSAAVAVALIVGAIQTMTQMNEPVVAQVPRQIVVLGVVVLVLPWLVATWVAYARAVIGGLGAGM
jgi:flagellar biosynthesis protein FliQ